MSRRFITAVLTAATLITASVAAPAQAADDELAAFVGLAAGLMLLGTVLDRAEVTVGRSAPRHVAPPPRAHFQAPAARAHRPAPPVREGRPGHRAAGVLPARCLRESPVAGTRAVMGRPCLRQAGIAPQSLPRACILRAYVGDRIRSGYSVRCLRQNGYRVSGRSGR